ncbi:MAG TPA: SUMF1/EgtB/PvdO family nonheme iron enzyme [Opitutaceae bacterium]
MPYVRSFSGRLADAWMVVRPWVLSVLGLAALAALWWWLTTLGPRRVDTGAPEVRASLDPAVERLSVEIDELERQYGRAVEAGAVTPAARSWLAEALAKQQELLKLAPDAGYDQGVRLQRLEGERDSLKARENIVRIEQLEAAGQEALAGRRGAEASEKLRQALQLQREINGSNAGARFKNYVRETQLVQQLAGLEAEPLARELEAALAAARAAAGEQRWADALAAYVQARDMQARINREYPRTRYANLTGVDRLEAEIASLNAGGIANAIDTRELAGDTALAAGDYATAAQAFAGAQTMQLEINQKFARSRFVSSARMETLEIKRQTALSVPAADALQALDATIAEHLRRRQVFTAVEKVAQAVTAADRLFAEYPKSRRLDGRLKIKLSYLQLRRDDLRALQDQVYDQLLPLPGVSERLMLRTELLQPLYLLVMTTNPSRNPGRALPVDSVSWADAQEFCERLGWMLGTRVRLPSPDEFRIALADADHVQAWSAESAEGHSRESGRLPANSVGFHDLTGNLAEWLDASAEAATAPLGGGSYLDAGAVLAKFPVVPQPKGDRARHIGFRVVVELPLE